MTATTDRQGTIAGLLPALAGGTSTVELGHPHFTGMPCSPNHPGFRMTLIRRHGDMVRADNTSAANEIIVTGGHVGTHVDALSHVSCDGKLFGGVDVQEAQAGGKFSHLGAETMPVFLTRGVLLDIPGTKGVERLDPGYGVSADDLRESLERAGTELRQGDVALIRTGWSQHFYTEPATYLGQSDGVPGPDTTAAELLASAGVVAAGADTTAFEQIKAGAGHSLLPVHRMLLVEHGIHIIEHLNLEDAAARGLTEFLFVMAPLRIEGGTGSPVRPVAVIDA